MAVCIACGTENRDNAMFCRGCATSMVALAGTQMAAKAPAAAAAPETKGPTQECPACKTRNPLVATSCKSCGASLVPDMSPTVKAVAQPVATSRTRTPMWLAVGAALVATAAAAWWLGAHTTRSAPQVAATVDSDRPLALGVNLNTTPPPQAPLDAAAPAAPAPSDPLTAAAAAAEQADRIKKQAAGVTEADRKRRQVERQQKEARERAAAERQRQAQEQARQAELERQRAEEAARQQQALAAARPVAPPEPVRTVDLVCADSGNFIAREVCRTRECRNPGFTNDPVCVRFREVEAANRRQPMF